MNWAQGQMPNTGRSRSSMDEEETREYLAGETTWRATLICEKYRENPL